MVSFLAWFVATPLSLVVWLPTKHTKLWFVVSHVYYSESIHVHKHSLLGTKQVFVGFELIWPPRCLDACSARSKVCVQFGSDWWFIASSTGGTQSGRPSPEIPATTVKSSDSTLRFNEKSELL